VRRSRSTTPTALSLFERDPALKSLAWGMVRTNQARDWSRVDVVWLNPAPAKGISKQQNPS